MSAAVSTLPRLGNVECGTIMTRLSVSFALYLSSTPGAVLLPPSSCLFGTVRPINIVVRQDDDPYAICCSCPGHNCVL